MSDKLRSTKSVHQQNRTNAAAAAGGGGGGDIATDLMQKLRVKEGRSSSDTDSRAVVPGDFRRGGFFLAGGGRGLDSTTRARALINLLRRNVDQLLLQREIGFSFSAAELTGGGVVRTRRFLGRVEGTEPDAALLAGISDLGSVSAPRPLSNASEMEFFSIGVVAERREALGGGFFLGNHGGRCTSFFKSARDGSTCKLFGLH